MAVPISTPTSAFSSRHSHFFYIVLSILLLAPNPASSLPSFLLLIPNGYAYEREDSGIQCQFLGHSQCMAGAPRNNFGADFEREGFAWTKSLCETDSDGDGLTNGQELGDPCCKWTANNPDAVTLRLTDLSHPGDATKTNTAPKECPDDQPSSSSTSPSPSLSQSSIPSSSLSQIPSSPTSVPVSKSPSPTLSSISSTLSSSPTPSIIPSPSIDTDDDNDSATLSPEFTIMISPIIPRPSVPSPMLSFKPSPSPFDIPVSATDSVDQSETATSTPRKPSDMDGDNTEVVDSTPLSPSLSPSVTAENTDDDDDDGRVCFPGHVTVTLRNGLEKRMEHVVVGDEVMVGVDLYSPVFMRTHYSNSKGYEFISLYVTSNTHVSLTPGHYIYINNEKDGFPMAVRADMVRLNDTLEIVRDGQSRHEKIVRVERSRFIGLYNPQTEHGDIIVNGVRASTYTSAIKPETAHALLTPLRALFRWLRISFTTFERHGRVFLSLLPKGKAER